tara:strand:+ start:299 stop:589 length:291 start_codon:yes stop_codon:yes gene_type:complete
MKQNIKTVLLAIDQNLNKLQPKTMDELISAVHSTEGAGNYGTHFSIVKYMGYLQGIRVHVTGRSKTHTLPTKERVYATMQGTEKYEAAGFQVEYSN